MLVVLLYVFLIVFLLVQTAPSEGSIKKKTRIWLSLALQAAQVVCFVVVLCINDAQVVDAVGIMAINMMMLTVVLSLRKNYRNWLAIVCDGIALALIVVYCVIAPTTEYNQENPVGWFVFLLYVVNCVLIEYGVIDTRKKVRKQ